MFVGDREHVDAAGIVKRLVRGDEALGVGGEEGVDDHRQAAKTQRKAALAERSQSHLPRTDRQPIAELAQNRGERPGKAHGVVPGPVNLTPPWYSPTGVSATWPA